MWIITLSYSNQTLLQFQVLNLYHQLHILMSSFLSRGLINMRFELFSLYNIEWEKYGNLELDPIIASSAGTYSQYGIINDAIQFMTLQLTPNESQKEYSNFQKTDQCHRSTLPIGRPIMTSKLPKYYSNLLLHWHSQGFWK